jgi:hypothetical protein
VLMWRHASGLRSLLGAYGPTTTDDWRKSLNRPAPKDVCRTERGATGAQLF